jgi:phospholipid/cholesterol/gamma-HCH transport system substrate-binding protein
MPTQLKSIMIGIFVVSACALIVFILLFLHPTVGDEAKTLRVRFTDIDKVNIGTRVTFAGRPVGEVAEIKEIEGARHQHIEHSGEVYIYELTLRVDSGVYIFNTDEVALRTSGLLGEKNVAILPMPPTSPDEKIYPIDQEVIYANSTQSMEATFKDIASLSKKFERALDGVIDAIDTMKKEQVISKIGQAVDHVNAIAAALDKPDEWSRTLSNVHRLSERANASWDSLDKSLENFHVSSSNMKDLTNEGKTIVSNIGKGEGTLGHLLVGDDLYLRLNSILSKGEIVMDDVNQYGMLFHTNKRWQRKQAQRMNLLYTLSTPQTFTRYFTTELNQISDSLSRVSLILQETENQHYPDYVIQNPDFTNKFAELLKKFDKMQEELTMYNQQVVACSKE